MSYNLTIPQTTIKDFTANSDALLEAEHDRLEQQNPSCFESARQGLKAAQAIVASGVVGGPDAEVSATVSGHSNPEHVHTEGMSDDFMQISVYQKQPVKPEA